MITAGKLRTSFDATFRQTFKLVSTQQVQKFHSHDPLGTKVDIVEPDDSSTEKRRIKGQIVQAFTSRHPSTDQSTEKRKMSSRLVQAFTSRLPSTEKRRMSSQLVQAFHPRLQTSNTPSSNFMRRMSLHVRRKVSQHTLFKRTLPKLRGLIYWKRQPPLPAFIEAEPLDTRDKHIEIEEMDDPLNEQTRIWITQFTQDWTHAQLDEISSNVSNLVVQATVRIQRWIRSCRCREYYQTVELPRKTLAKTLLRLSNQLRSDQAQLDQVRQVVHTTALSVQNQLELHAQHHEAAVVIQRLVRGKAGRKAALRRRFVIERRRLFDLQRERLASAKRALYRPTPAQIRAQEATHLRVWSRSEQAPETAHPQISHFEEARPHPGAQIASYSDGGLACKGVFPMRKTPSRQRYRPSHWLDPVRIHAAPSTLDDGLYHVTKMSCVEYGRFRVFQRHKSPFAHSRLHCSLESRDELLWVGVPVTISETLPKTSNKQHQAYFRMEYDWLPASHVPTMTMTAR